MLKTGFCITPLPENWYIAALVPTQLVFASVAEIKLEKKRVRMGLEKIPHVVKIFPSAANFLLFRVKSNSKEIYRAIAKAGVVIRYRGDNHGCSECLRATVGRPKDNDTFLEKLKQVIADVVSK